MSEYESAEGLTRVHAFVPGADRALCGMPVDRPRQGRYARPTGMEWFTPKELERKDLEDRPCKRCRVAVEKVT